MITLGINAAFHDCSACLVVDGVVQAAAEEERFTRIKHGKRPVPFTVWQLPWHAIAFCLEQAGITMAGVDHVAYAYDPALLLGERRKQPQISLPLEPSAPGSGGSWEDLALAYVVNAPRQLAGGAPHHLRHLFRERGHWRWHHVEHHAAHEASAYLAAPFEACAVLVMDGRGEQACTSYGMWNGSRYERIGQVDFPHSLGLLYESLTEYLGFLHSSDEYKVMALASFGKPAYAGRLRECVRFVDGGQYRITEPDWAALAGPPRQRGGPIRQEHMDLAHSLQLVLEESVFKLADWLHDQTGASQLAMAGGVALNCVLNGRLRERGPFADIWVQPAAGDAGTALGAALLVDAKQRGNPPRTWTMEHAFFGPEYAERDIAALLDQSKLAYTQPDDLPAACADLLAGGSVIGWFQGRMEFGPRALGARSILASPLDPQMQEKLNHIKDREDFRPVAPAVLQEAAADWFEHDWRSPYMLFVDRVRRDKVERIPAVCHVDGSARVQTVDAATNPAFHRLLRAFGDRTGVPVLVNTSFNTRGEPVVCTPRDALAAYFTGPLDALAIGPFLLHKHAAEART